MQAPWPEIAQIVPSIQVGFSLILSCSELTMSAVPIYPRTMQMPPRMAVFLGDSHLRRSPGRIPNREKPFRMKSNQSKRSSLIVYFSLMKSKYL